MEPGHFGCLETYDGIETHTFKSANGRYKIELVKNLLTVNGAKYTLKGPGASIHIEDGKVEINGIETAPDTE